MNIKELFKTSTQALDRSADAVKRHTINFAFVAAVGLTALGTYAFVYGENPNTRSAGIVGLFGPIIGGIAWVARSVERKEKEVSHVSDNSESHKPEARL